MTHIIPRSAWGAPDTTPGYVLAHPVAKVIVHHFYAPDVPADASPEREAAVLQGVDRFHRDNGWGGLGYQFVAFDSGRAYEGRGWDRTGAHTAGQNSKSIAICFAINGDAADATDAAWDAAAGIVAEGVRLGKIAEQFTVSGHRDYTNKSCPGALVYPHLHRLTAPQHEEDDVALTDADKAWIDERISFHISGRDRVLNAMHDALVRIEQKVQR